jgi:hypothetical protein
VLATKGEAPYHGLLTHQGHERAAVLAFDVVKVGHGGSTLVSFLDLLNAGIRNTKPCGNRSDGLSIICGFDYRLVAIFLCSRW